MNRRNVARVAAPVAFLAAVTIGALVVRAGFQHGRHHSGPSVTTVTSKTKTTSHHVHKKPHVKTYTVQPGDTFGSIAARLGTTAADLERLNPGVDPTTLRVGQKIRVQ